MRITHFLLTNDLYVCFSREILKMSDSIDDAGAPVYDLVLTCMLVWIVVFLALFKGISSLGKVRYNP